MNGIVDCTAGQWEEYGGLVKYSLETFRSQRKKLLRGFLRGLWKPEVGPLGRGIEAQKDHLEVEVRGRTTW